MEKALELLATVAEKGNPYAQYLLGKIYYWGNSVDQDREKGLEYIRRAAEQGHPGAVGFLERLAQWESQRIHEQAVPLFPLATRLLRQVGQIFRRQFSLDPPVARLVDTKAPPEDRREEAGPWAKTRNVIGGIPITKKQRYLAGRTDLVALLRSRGETLKRLGSEWEWKFHDERVTIRNNVWFDQYTQKGGDAVDFFRYFYGESEEQAAAMLLNCSVSDLEKLPARSPPVPRPSKKNRNSWKSRPPITICGGCSLTCARPGASPRRWCPPLPGRASSMRAQTTTTPSLWAGDEQGKVRHLHARGTLTGSHFRQTLPGSEKEYSFHWLGASGKLYAFEAPVDMLSYISLHPEGWQNHTYVALCGVSAAPIHHCWKLSPSWRKSPCAWTVMRLATTLPAGSPANCCGSGTSPCPLSSPRSRTGMMSCSPTARRKPRD